MILFIKENYWFDVLVQNVCVQKSSVLLFYKIQSLFKNRQKILISEIFPVCINDFAIFRVACEFLDDRSSPASKQ